MRYDIDGRLYNDGLWEMYEDGSYKRRQHAELHAQELVASGERTTTQVMRDDGRIIAFYDAEEVVMGQVYQPTVRVMPSGPDEVHVEVVVAVDDDATEEDIIRAATVAVRRDIQRRHRGTDAD